MIVSRGKEQSTANWIVRNGVPCVQDASVPVGATYQVLEAWAAIADVPISAATSAEAPRMRTEARMNIMVRLLSSTWQNVTVPPGRRNDQGRATQLSSTQIRTLPTGLVRYF